MPLLATEGWASYGEATRARCMDATSCRVNALLEYPLGLPTFSPLDEIERVLDEEGFFTCPLDDWDYIYVDCPEVDLNDPVAARAAFPWSGSRFYAYAAVKYMLQIHAITCDNLVYGIKASRRLDPKILGGAFDKVRECFREAMAEENLDEEGLTFAQDLHLELDRLLQSHRERLLV